MSTTLRAGLDGSRTVPLDGRENSCHFTAHRRLTWPSPSISSPRSRAYNGYSTSPATNSVAATERVSRHVRRSAFCHSARTSAGNSTSVVSLLITATTKHAELAAAASRLRRGEVATANAARSHGTAMLSR